MTSSVTDKIRRNHTDDILRHYHDTLQTLCNGTAPYSYENFKSYVQYTPQIHIPIYSSYEQTFRFAVCFFLPMYQGMFKMIDSGMIHAGGVDPAVFKTKMLDDLKSLLEDTLTYIDKYD